ncbi:MAG: hypothetical protein M1838_002861 [Thelocarpon superellum]|nr:MAG: hypothetical protein M1838_002861 [Thelocarpon superellum]
MAFTMSTRNASADLTNQLIAATDGGLFIGLPANISCNSDDGRCLQYGQSALQVDAQGTCHLVEDGKVSLEGYALNVDSTSGEVSYGTSPASDGFSYVPATNPTPTAANHYNGGHYGELYFKDAAGQTLDWRACPAGPNVWRLAVAVPSTPADCVPTEVNPSPVAYCCFNYVEPPCQVEGADGCLVPANQGSGRWSCGARCATKMGITRVMEEKLLHQLLRRLKSDSIAGVAYVVV